MTNQFDLTDDQRQIQKMARRFAAVIPTMG